MYIGNINDLCHILQNLHPKIKFSMEYSLKELPFLDVLIKNEKGEKTTDIYHKPTDTQQYLHFNSHHSKNCLKSIPYSLACRICTIITNKKLRKFHLKELYINLHQRGYPKILLNKGIQIAEKIPLKELRSHGKHINEKLLTYIITYNKNNTELFGEITKNLEELKHNDKIKEILDTTKIIKSHQQPKNLEIKKPKKNRTSSKFGEQHINWVNKCKNKKCGVCNIIIEG